MADDWRYMRAEMPHPGPSGSGMWYNVPDRFDVEFTNPPNDGENGPWIEDIRQQIMNQHPEDISALADQWNRAWQLLFGIQQQVLQTSNDLYEKDWKDGDAREKFMTAGPGKMLAYLQSWMDSALDNVAALRAQVTIVRAARTEMEGMWSRYKSAIDKASETDGTFGNWFWHYNLIPGGDQTDYDNANKRDAIEQINEKKKEFAREAQGLAHRTAQQIFQTYSTVGNGHGAPFFPMNALLTPIGQPNPISLGGPPGGMPGGPPPGLNQSLLNLQKNPPVIPNPVSTNPLQPVLNVTNPPNVLPPGGLPNPTIVPPVLPPGVRPPGQPLAKPTTLNPNVTSPFAKLVPKGLNPGLIQAKGMVAPTGDMTPGALRSPGSTPPAPPMSNGAQRQNPRANPAGTGRQQEKLNGITRQGGVEEPFARQQSGTVPPVLNNKQRGASGKPGSQSELHPQSRQAAGTTSPLRPAGAAPPVLKAPSQSPMLPPGQPGSRTTRKTATGNGQPGQPVPNSDWAGVEAARSDVAAPILDAPAPPPTGAAVSKLEEVKLRGRAAATGARSGGQSRIKAGPTVSPELTARKARRDGSGTGSEADESGNRIVTDDVAFSVETPGGGVVAKQQDTRAYRPEAPTVLGGGA